MDVDSTLYTFSGNIPTLTGCILFRFFWWSCYNPQWATELRIPPAANGAVRKDGGERRPSSSDPDLSEGSTSQVTGRGCDTVLLGLFLGRPLNYLLSTGAPSSSCVSKFEWGPGKIECLGMGLGFSWSYPTTTEGVGNRFVGSS